MSNVLSKKFNMCSLLAFVIPSVIMMIIVAITAMSGSIFAAKYIGENALSAINIVFPLISTVLAIAIMLSTGANAIIATNLGEGKLDKARENFSRICLFGIKSGFLLTIISIFFRTQIVKLLGSPESLQDLCEIYLIGYALCFPFVFLQMHAQYFFVTVGKPIFGMIIVTLGGIANVILSYFCIAVWNMGIIGAAIGAAISYILPGTIYLIYFLINKKGVLYFVKPKNHFNFLLKTFTNGSSEMVTNLAIAIVTTILNILMFNLKGEDGIAAVSIIVHVQFLLNSMYIGFGGGVAPIFAYANGEKNYSQIKKVLSLSLKFVSISSILLVVFCLIFSNYIITIFLESDSSAFLISKNGFIIFSVSYLFAGINIFTSVFFTSLSNGKLSALISFLRTFVFIVGMLLFLPNILGYIGVWLAIPIAEFLGIIVVFILLKNYIKKRE